MKGLVWICLVWISLTTAAKPEALLISSAEEIDPCRSENKSFQGGEELVYKIYYNWNFVWLPAGEVVFKVSETDTEYQIVAKGRTYASYEWFYKVNDVYRTRLDKSTLLPLVFEREIHEGSFRWYNRIEFDQSAGSVRTLDGPNRKEAKWGTGSISGCMHDMMSIIYQLRTVSFSQIKKGTSFPVQVYLDGKAYSLDVLFGGQSVGQSIKGLGEFNTLKFSPAVVEGHQFNEGTRIDVWVGDDVNRVPLLIESPVSVGSVKAVLKSYKGLRNPLVSRCK
jgi:hypothetical protein